MEALKLKVRTSDGKLTVAVPDEFNNKEVEVIVLSSVEASSFADNETAVKGKDERIKRLLSVIGTAKYPEQSIDKYDVYEQ